MIAQSSIYHFYFNIFLRNTEQCNFFSQFIMTKGMIWHRFKCSTLVGQIHCRWWKTSTKQHLVNCDKALNVNMCKMPSLMLYPLLGLGLSLGSFLCFYIYVKQCDIPAGISKHQAEKFISQGYEQRGQACQSLGSASRLATTINILLYSLENFTSNQVHRSRRMDKSCSDETKNKGGKKGSEWKTECLKRKINLFPFPSSLVENEPEINSLRLLLLLISVFFDFFQLP